MTDLSDLSDQPAPLSAASALEHILTAQAEAFATAFAGLVESDEPEYPHKARVALRRLRSALDGFAPITDDGARKRMAGKARKLFRDLGPLRDADVMAHGFAAPEDKDAALAHADTLRAQVRSRLADRAAEFAADMAEALQGGALIAGSGTARRLAGAPAPILAQLALQRAWAEVQSFGPGIATLSTEDRHEFRKDMKTLRYLSEFFAAYWPGAARDRFLARMEKLQDDLGELNDIAAVAGGAGEDPALTARFDKALEKAVRHWQRLSAEGPWWLAAPADPDAPAPAGKGGPRTRAAKR